MVSAIKKWLGPTVNERLEKLEQENLRLAKVSLLRAKRIEKLEESVAKLQELAVEREKSLTSEPAKQKIPVKPKVQSWKNFKSSIEKASVPEEEI